MDPPWHFITAGRTAAAERLLNMVLMIFIAVVIITVMSLFPPQLCTLAGTMNDAPNP